MKGKMYRIRKGPNDDDFIVMEELGSMVALVNTRTNGVTWVTRHILKLEFELKDKS